MAKTLLKESRFPLPKFKRAGRLRSRLHAVQEPAVQEPDSRKGFASIAILLVALSVLSSLLFVGLRLESNVVAAKPTDLDSVVAVSSENQEVKSAGLSDKSPGADPNGILSAEETVDLVQNALQNKDLAQMENYFILGASAATPREAIELNERMKAKDGLTQSIEYLGEKVIPGGVAKEVLISSINGSKESNRLAQLLCING